MKRIFIELSAKQMCANPYIWFKEVHLHRALWKTDYETFRATLLTQRNVSSSSFVQKKKSTKHWNHRFDSMKRIFIELSAKQMCANPYIWLREVHLHLVLGKTEYKTFWTTHLIQRNVSLSSFVQNREKQTFWTTHLIQRNVSSLNFGQNIVQNILKVHIQIYNHTRIFSSQ